MYRKPLFILVLLSLLLGLTPTFAAGSIDLDIRDIEVSQGIQNLSNNMPLIALRRTIVRVYPINLPGSNVPGVKARLKVYKMNGQQATLLGTLTAKNNPITVQGNGGLRTNLNHSFWFEIPKLWMSGQVRFAAELNYDNAVADSNSANNTQVVTLNTRVSRALNVRMIPVHLRRNNTDVTYPCGTMCLTIASGVVRYHPTETLNISKSNSAVFPASHFKNHWNDWNIASDKDQSHILGRLIAKRIWEADYDRNYYGMIDPVFGYFGRAKLNGEVGLGTMNPDTGGISTWHQYGAQIMAHELGHNQNLKHVSCDGTESAGGATDPNYPWSFPNCQLAAIDSRGYYGLDTYYSLLGQAVPMPISNNPTQPYPQRAFPMMGYKNPSWISPWEFCKLMPVYGIPCNLSFSKNTLNPDAQPVQTGERSTNPTELVRSQMALSQVQDVQNFAQISGIVDDATSEVELDPIYVRTVITPAMRQEWAKHRSSGQTISDYRPQATWEIAIVDAAGGMLHRQYVLFDIDDHDGTTFATLGDIVPLPAGSQTLQILRNGIPVVERTMSANAPVSQITTSSGPLAAGTVLNWSASDADGDALSHTLLYSGDNWSTWQALEMDVSTDALTLTAEMVADLPASQRGQLKLVTTDGFRTVESIAPATFQVANHAPEAHIESPSADSWAGLDEQILLEGTASDVDQTSVAETSFAWSSDIDGALGTGSSLLVERLSPGQHVITLTVTDDAGLVTSTQVTTNIGTAPQRLKPFAGR